MIRRARKAMTISQLKRAMDRRFDQVQRSMDRRFRAVDRRFSSSDQRFRTIDQRFRTIDQRFRTIDRRFRAVDRRFDRIERTMATKSELKQLREKMVLSDEETRRRIDELEWKMRRHFDTVAESLRDDLRIFADAIGLHSERLDRHDTRITQLERRSL